MMFVVFVFDVSVIGLLTMIIYLQRRRIVATMKFRNS